MSFFKYLKIEEKIDKNPMDKIGVVKVEQHIIETLTDEEAEMVRCACDNERDLAIIDILSGSGMRVSELTGLNKDDVNFETGEIKVFGKGAKERTCFLTGRAKVHLKWYLESRCDNNPALFVTAKKPYTRLTKNGVEYILKNIAKNSKVPRVRLYPHKYRSTLATNMINKGASADKVQKILGHQSVDTTLKCYARVDKETVKSAHHTYVG
jgi:site-specific recombinase XerD